MMNEARIGVGTAAVMLGMAGYYAALEYARNRPQGRPGRARAGKDPAQPQVRIIEHADVKRMLLAQKSYCEGALALELYCARLVDEQHTGAAAGGRRRAPAAGSADADRQELAQRMVPGGQFAGDPGPRRLRLHARLPGRAVLARQPPEHDPRRHARHPGRRPAGAQGADGRRQGPDAAGRAHGRHHRARAWRIRSWPSTRNALRQALAQVQCRHPGRLGYRQPGRGAGQRRAVHAGLRAHGGGLDLARRGAGRRTPQRRHGDPARQGRLHADALLLPLRTAEDRRLAATWPPAAIRPARRCRRRPSDGFGRGRWPGSTGWSGP